MYHQLHIDNLIHDFIHFTGSTSNGRTRGILRGRKVEISAVHQRKLTGIGRDSFGYQNLKFGTNWTWQVLDFQPCLRCNKICCVQQGFLADQSNPDTHGNILRYDIEDGIFHLTTENYVKVHCKMSFGLYPFDTQTCFFRMRTSRDIGEQVTMKK